MILPLQAEVVVIIGGHDVRPDAITLMGSCVLLTEQLVARAAGQSCGAALSMTMRRDTLSQGKMLRTAQVG